VVFRKTGVRRPPAPAADEAPATTKGRGDAAEDLALAHLQRQGLRWCGATSSTPGRGGGEIDLIMREPDGTLVFVEVRQRASKRQGGAGASITAGQAAAHRVRGAALFAAPGSEPPCRFDVVLIHGACPRPPDQRPPQIEWLRAAFDAGCRRFYTTRPL
jgi:putative endonuclease